MSNDGCSSSVMWLLKLAFFLLIVVVVVVVFFICWAPFHAQRLLVIYLKREDWTPALVLLQNVLYYISGVLYYVSAVVNPILYNIMSLKFRQAFRNTIFRPCCWGVHRHQPSSQQQHQQQQQQQQRQQKVYRFTRKPFTDSNMTLTALRKQLNNNNVADSPAAGGRVSSSHQQANGYVAGKGSSMRCASVNGGAGQQTNGASSSSNSDNLFADLEMALYTDGQRHYHSYHHARPSPSIGSYQRRKYHSCN